MISVIYVEQEIAKHPRTLAILDRFCDATVVTCDRYGEIVNRTAQNFRLQKSRPALILAQKFDNHVLPTPQGYGIGGHHNYYFSHMLNCLYDCRYCFLQGMYRSANYLLFVNYEDFKASMQATVAAHDPDDEVYFFSGYDCDSMALEQVSGFVSDFVPFMTQLPSAWLELRTKSVNIRALTDIEPVNNCVIAFSMTPPEVASALEHGAPPITSRIQAMARLAGLGWKLGLRFDPLIYHPAFRDTYRDLFQSVFKALPIDAVHSVSLGPLRFPPAMFDKITKLYPKERLFAGPLVKNRSMVCYPEAIESEMTEFCEDELSQYVPKSRFFACTPGGSQ